MSTNDPIEARGVIKGFVLAHNPPPGVMNALDVLMSASLTTPLPSAPIPDRSDLMPAPRPVPMPDKVFPQVTAIPLHPRKKKQYPPTVKHWDHTTDDVDLMRALNKKEPMKPEEIQKELLPHRTVAAIKQRITYLRKKKRVQ